MSATLTFGIIAVAVWSLIFLLLLWASVSCWRRYEHHREQVELDREQARQPARVAVLAPEPWGDEL